MASRDISHEIAGLQGWLRSENVFSLSPAWNVDIDLTIFLDKQMQFSVTFLKVARRRAIAFSDFSLQYS